MLAGLSKRIFVAAVSLGMAAGISGCASAAEKVEVDLIVSGAYVITMDEARPVIANGAVAIDEGVILAVGAQSDIAAGYSAAREIDGANRALLPGLINGHGHAAMVLFRGMADDLDLMTWLQNYIFPMEGRFVDPEFVRIGVQLACWEMIRGGTTTFVDMYFYPEVSSAVVEECGLRAIIGAPSIDFPSPGFKGWEDSFAASIDYVKRWTGRNSRITPAFAPHSAYTITPDHLTQLLASARELDAPVLTHIAEDKSELPILQERYGKTPVVHFADMGFLDHKLIAAHMVWPSPDEISMLARDGVGAIHNPTSNMKTAAGISPVPELLAAGVHVGLGTDGAASNNNLDMWGEIRLAALIHKGFRGDATVMPAPVVLRMATAGGAKAIGLGDTIGALVPGLRADMIQVSLESPGLAPLYDIISHLVYVVNSRDVVTTIVDGRILMQDGEVLTLDAATVRAAAMEKGREMSASMQKAAR